MEENMLNAIYTLLTLDVVIAEILCIIFITIMSFRKELKTTQYIKFQLIMVSVICLLTFAEIILGIFTQESIIYIIWNIFLKIRESFINKFISNSFIFYISLLYIIIN